MFCDKHNVTLSYNYAETLAYIEVINYNLKSDTVILGETLIATHTQSYMY